MRTITIFLCLAFTSTFSAIAIGNDALSYEIELSLSYSELDNLSLGDEPNEDQIIEEEYEAAFLIEYQYSEQLYFFFGGSLIDEREEVKPQGERETVSGFERGDMGIGYVFGEEIESEFKIGRQEHVSTSDWWYWWDEDLDSISLQSRFGKFETLLAFAEEQAPEVSDMDRIDPELEDLQRILASFDWEFADGQLLQFYYLDQTDNSSSYDDGDSVDEEKFDEEDADLTWSGVTYLGWFEFENIGEIEVELAWAQVSGRETLYELDAGAIDGAETTDQRVSGDAYGARVGWTPSMFDGISLIAAYARGTGDSPDEDDNKDGSFRQSGLQGESDVFGELYEPELSNLIVTTLGVEFSLSNNLDIGIFRYDYRQDELSDEMRDVGIEADLDGMNRDLGREIDLVLTFDLYDIEVEITAAEFKAGEAYGENRGETSRYWEVEFTYEF